MPRYCTCRQKKTARDRIFADSHGPEWPMRITARPRRLLAGPCRVKERGDTREREAESPGNRRLPDFVVLLVGLRNRSKFRFVPLPCISASPCHACCFVPVITDAALTLRCSTSCLHVKAYSNQRFTKLQTLFRKLFSPSCAMKTSIVRWRVSHASSALRIAAVETGHAAIHLDDGLR